MHHNWSPVIRITWFTLTVLHVQWCRRYLMTIKTTYLVIRLITGLSKHIYWQDPYLVTVDRVPQASQRQRIENTSWIKQPGWCFSCYWLVLIRSFQGSISSKTRSRGKGIEEQPAMTLYQRYIPFKKVHYNTWNVWTGSILLTRSIKSTLSLHYTS